MPEITSNLQPLSIPADGFASMGSDSVFTGKMRAIIEKAESEGCWQEAERVPQRLDDHYFWAYWLYKTAHPIVRPLPGSGLADHFAPFKTHRFRLQPETFAPEEHLTLSLSGDLMATPGLSGSFRTLYADVADLIFDVDFAFANLESTLTRQPVKPTVFSTEELTLINIPPEAYDVLVKWGGRKYDLVALANNHILDQGEEGIRTTLDQLKTDRIGQVGINETPETVNQTAITDVNGVRIGWVAHTYYAETQMIPEDKLFMLNLTPFHMVEDPDTSQIERQIRYCREQKCDLVVASLHWGLEFELYPHPEQLAWARRFAECGADMIVGHHPHIIQPLELYQPKRDPDRMVPILYSLGNLTPIMSGPATVLSLVSRLTLARGSLNGKAVVMPVELTLTPTITLQHGSGTGAPLGIFRLSQLLSDGTADDDIRLRTYLNESAAYADLVLGTGWRRELATK